MHLSQVSKSGPYAKGTDVLGSPWLINSCINKPITNTKQTTQQCARALQWGGGGVLAIVTLVIKNMFFLLLVVYIKLIALIVMLVLHQ